MSDPGRIRRCANSCFFCFLNGLPEGLRPSLYVKDDDVLHSFLFGNFVTLTNFGEADWRRLEERRYSPLFVSVHTTDPELRRQMMGNPKAPDIVEQIRRLGRLRIQVHAQVVLCPGVNDGDHLTKTIADLAGLHPTVQSIAIVPVGLTKHSPARKGAAIRRYTAAEAAALIDRLLPIQKIFRRDLGSTLVYLADEFYLMAGAPIPSTAHYYRYPQLGNGIGLTRKLLEEARRLHRKPGAPAAAGGAKAPGLVRWQDCRSSPPDRRRVVAVCGMLIAPTLLRIVSGLGPFGCEEIELVPVKNQFFGPLVTVSGLLTGGDVIFALREQAPIDLLILPRNMLDRDGARFLDDLTPADIERELGAKVAIAGGLRELISAMSSQE